MMAATPVQDYPQPDHPPSYMPPGSAILPPPQLVHGDSHIDPRLDPHLAQSNTHHHNMFNAGGSPRYQPYAPRPMPHSNEQSPDDQNGQGPGGQGRVLSTSKRAEQNRKAQRAFRERREQHVKQLESRSQLLDAALASADAANRRYEEARAMLEQLRSENAQLRAQLHAATGPSKSSSTANGSEPKQQQQSQQQNGFAQPGQPISNCRTESRTAASRRSSIDEGQAS